METWKRIKSPLEEEMSDKEVEDAWRVRGGAGGNTGIKRGGEKGVGRVPQGLDLRPSRLFSNVPPPPPALAHNSSKARQYLIHLHAGTNCPLFLQTLVIASLQNGSIQNDGQ